MGLEVVCAAGAVLLLVALIWGATHYRRRRELYPHYAPAQSMLAFALLFRGIPAGTFDLQGATARPGG